MKINHNFCIKLVPLVIFIDWWLWWCKSSWGG